MADDLFSQADLNRDDRLDLNEFRSFLTNNLRRSSPNAIGVGSQHTASSYELSSSATYGDTGGAAELTGANFNAAGAGGGGEASYGSYGQPSYALASGGGGGGGEVSYGSYGQSSYALASGGDADAFDANTSSSFGIGGLETNVSSGIDLTTAAVGASSSSTFQVNSSQQQVQVDASNPKNLYQDPNPQIVRRPAPGGGVTYTQNIRVRFLQPPPVPPPGPLIIKEVRPPQPPVPPPLRIRQQAPPVAPAPPLILRERPPVPPVSAASQTVIRQLAPLPVPPRSVIIERLPPLPPKPRDIIIERWIPYTVSTKRKTIVQRAEAAKEYPKPRNIIIQYEPVQVRIVRQFQRLGITQENPQVYVQRYGVSLLDPQTLVQQARAAGVVEDISAPTNVATTVAADSSSFSTEFNSANSGIETTGGGGGGLTFGNDVGASASSFESSSYSGGQQGNANSSGFISAQGAGLSSLSYDSSSFLSQGGNAAYGGADIGGTSTSGHESYNTSTGGINSSDVDPALVAFHAADLNKDGALDTNEFGQFISANLQHSQ